MKHGLVLLAFAAIAACATAPASIPAKGPDASEPAVMPPEQADACKAKSYQGLIGKPATDSGVPPAGRLVRHIRPDSIVTMDYVFARLNIEIDTRDIVTAVRCG